MFRINWLGNVVCMVIVCVSLASGASADMGDQLYRLSESVAGFGCSVATSGNTAIVGAQYDNEAASLAGAAYIFELEPTGEWTQSTKLKASDAEASDWFGHSVSVSGSYALVGAYGKGDYHPHGAAYMFERGPSGWTETAKLVASDGQAGDLFGYSVSVSGNRAIVGTSAGAAYIFEQNASGVWGEVAILKASDLSGTQGLFGQSVAISGDYAVVGAYGADGTPSGAAYIFHRDGEGSWSEDTKLTASDPDPAGGAFGWSVTIDGTRALVGAMGKDENGNDSGAAYIFDCDTDGVWIETAKLLASDGSEGDAFGISVALDGDFALIGANRFGHAPENPTAAYSFQHTGGGQWSEVAKLSGRSDLRDHYGEAVAITQDYAFVGAYGDDDGGNLSGAVYAYSVPEPVTLSLLALGGLALLQRKRK